MLHARPHLSVHSRANDHSAVNGAAYRLGLKLFDRRAQVWRDHTHRKPGEVIVYADTIAPVGAPAWATDPGLLWNRVEATERRKDAQVARDYRVPIPRGVSDEQAGDMARMLAQFIVQELHTPVSFAVHRDADKDAFGAIKPDGEQGFHAHLYFPTRSLRALGDGGESEGGGFGGKLKQFVNLASASAMTERLNAKWARVANLIAGQAGQPQTYDHRSYKRLGITCAPEPKLGQAATAMERRGIRTRKGDALRAHRAARARVTADQLVAQNAAPAFDPFAQPLEGLPAVPSAEPQGGTAPGEGVVQLQSASPIVGQAGPASDRTTVVESAPVLHPSTPATGPVHAAPGAPPRTAPHVRPRLPTAHRHVKAEQWLQVPAGHEPPPVVGLYARFEAAAVAKADGAGARVPNKVLRLVQAIEAALNALIRAVRGLGHLEQERRRYATARFDNHFAAEALRSQQDALRRAMPAPKGHLPVHLTATHRRQLSQIQTLEEEVVAKVRLGVSLDAQVQDLGERMDPFRVQVKDDRRRLKGHMAALADEGQSHVDTLLEVSNGTERPWIAMYQTKDEPYKSLQALVDEQERQARGPKLALRPKRH